MREGKGRGAEKEKKEGIYGSIEETSDARGSYRRCSLPFIDLLWVTIVVLYLGFLMLCIIVLSLTYQALFEFVLSKKYRVTIGILHKRLKHCWQ